MQCTSKMGYPDPNKADPLNWLRDVASLRLWNISYLERSWYHVYQYLLFSLYNKRNVQFSKFRFPENKLDFCWLSRKFLNGVFLKLYPHLYSSPLVLYPPPPPLPADSTHYLIYVVSTCLTKNVFKTWEIMISGQAFPLVGRPAHPGLWLVEERLSGLSSGVSLLAGHVAAARLDIIPQVHRAHFLRPLETGSFLGNSRSVFA